MLCLSSFALRSYSHYYGKVAHARVFRWENRVRAQFFGSKKPAHIHGFFLCKFPSPHGLIVNCIIVKKCVHLVSLERILDMTIIVHPFEVVSITRELTMWCKLLEGNEQYSYNNCSNYCTTHATPCTHDSSNVITTLNSSWNMYFHIPMTRRFSAAIRKCMRFPVSLA